MVGISTDRRVFPVAKKSFKKDTASCCRTNTSAKVPRAVSVVSNVIRSRLLSWHRFVRES